MSKLNISRMTIMIVDDDDEVRGIIKDYLTMFGFRSFIEARDGAEAYRFVLDTIQRIDLIISDWEMPRTDGLSLLKAVRSHNGRYQTPFIMVTSQQSQERMKITSAKRHAIDCYIVKPFRSEILREKVFQALKITEDAAQTG
ncbi:response regulator [Pseudobdellovibrio sp. HCB154]|uniref:response regulator n=1 Tax=Pseudobdellovibrio sp. HCB154 TaxID=3386277 RepID=UPI003916CE61